MLCKDYPNCDHWQVDHWNGSRCVDKRPVDTGSSFDGFISLVYLGGLITVAWVILHFILKYW